MKLILIICILTVPCFASRWEERQIRIEQRLIDEKIQREKEELRLRIAYEKRQIMLQRVQKRIQFKRDNFTIGERKCCTIFSDCPFVLTKDCYVRIELDKKHVEYLKLSKGKYAFKCKGYVKMTVSIAEFENQLYTNSSLFLTQNLNNQLLTQSKKISNNNS